MTAIWTDENRFKIWLEIEILSVEGWEQLGHVPSGTAAQIRRIVADKGGARDGGVFSVPRTLEIEKEVKHDVIAFLTNVNENVGELGRFFHLGMTSSDVLDTALAVQLVQATDILLADLDEVARVLRLRAEEHKHTVQIGRSHGIHAEPITFGLKLIGWYAEARRLRTLLEQARATIACGTISGAVGTFAHLDMQVETHILGTLGLSAEPVPTQVVQRDRHAQFFAVLALIASSLEKWAVEIRHLQRSEVLEAQEPFTVGQKGSSAMPHKRNPILSENLTGIARLIRSMALPAMENVALWHERDISHSSVERVIGPDATIALNFALRRFASMMQGLVVYPENMTANMDKLRGILFSQRVLLALVETGLSREEGYKIAQDAARQVWDEGKHFRAALESDSRVTTRLSAQVLDEIFASKRDLLYVDKLFERALAA